MTSSLPRGPRDLTPAWLTLALRQSGAIDEAAVTSAEIEEVGGVTGLIGTLARVRLGYDRPQAGAPETLIAKFPPRRGRTALASLGAVEARIYREIIDPAVLPAPRAFVAEAGDAGGRSLLLLENVAPSRVVRQIDGCYRQEALLAIRAIARFHAHWWEAADLGGLDWLPPVEQSNLGDHFGDVLRGYREEWNPVVRDIAPRLVREYDTIRAHLSGAPRTIVHGDFHSQNLLFGVDPGQSPVSVIDFQMAAVGQGAADVARFLATSLQPESRRAIEGELVAAYLETLEGEGVRDYSLDQCLADLRWGLLWDLASRLAFIGGGGRTAEGAWPPLPIVRRSLEAIRDWEAEELLGS